MATTAPGVLSEPAAAGLADLEVARGGRGGHDERGQGGRPRRARWTRGGAGPRCGGRVRERVAGQADREGQARPATGTRIRPMAMKVTRRRRGVIGITSLG